MSTPLRLESSIKEHLAPILRADGFSGSGRTYRRVVGDLIHVVNVQGSRYGGQFAINLAIHPTCIPDVLGELPDPKKITEAQCEFRRRLTDSGSDQWWSYENSPESMVAAVKAAANVYNVVGRKILAPFTSESSPLHVVTAESFERSQPNFHGFASTKVRMALALARFRKAKGHTEAAHEFAKVGQAAAGSAVALCKAFESIYAKA